MAVSEAEIVNMALMRVGVREHLDSLEEDSINAQMGKTAYNNTRDAILQRAWWPFAKKRSLLGLLTGVERTGWTYVYALPSDYLAARYIYLGRRLRPNQRAPFETELNDDGTGRILVTDVEDAELVYTAEVTNVTLFPPLFVDALAWGVACDLVLVLPVRPELSQAALARYELALSKAIIAARADEQDDARPESEFITARG